MILSWALVWLGCGGPVDTGAAPPTGATSPTSPTEPTTPTEPAEPEIRRWDCSGMTGADPAPLGGRVALTFDDGPDGDTTPRVVDILRRHGVPATFFMVGERVADPSGWPVLEDIVSDPAFDVANHSWSHTDFTTLDLDAAEDEIVATNEALAAFDVVPAFFRFPYGAADCALRDRVVEDLGMNVAGWHIDTADWCYAAYGGTCTRDDYWRVPEVYAADMEGWIVEQVVRFDGGVVLFHDIHDFTADALEGVILDLRDRGFTFVAMDDATAFPRLVAGTPYDLPYLGESCDPIGDLCWEVEFEAWCEPSDSEGTLGFCTLPCEGYCLDRDGAATTFCADVGGTGQCVGRSEGINEQCGLVPGTTPTPWDRFVGASGAEPATVDVCVPDDWG